MTTQTDKATATSPDQQPSAPRRALPEVPSWRRKLRPYLLSIPALVIVIGILYPFVVGAYYAFLNYAAVNPDPHFIWFANFKSVLGDQVFWQSVKVTAIFAVVATTVETVLGVGLALLLNRSSIIGKVFEKVLILPLMIAPVIAGVIWKLMFNPQFGILNHVLGLGNTFDWLSGSHALWSVILVDLWIFTPFVAILVLAGMRSLPKEPFEASDREPTPAEAALLAETLEQLMRELTPREQEILALRLQGYDSADISARVGRTERTVQRLLQRVRQRLEQMQEEG